MQPLPLVTVICTCYNHEQYVIQALQSVLSQSYPAIELIVVNNQGTDNSRQVIEKFLLQHPTILFIHHHINKGHCVSFNDACRLAKGSYLIDLAADDLFEPERVARQVACFEKLPKKYGLVYSNAEEVTPDLRHIRYSLPLQESPPQGLVFAHLLARHFIPSPSTIIRMTVFRELGGYNEKLAFEDFDFWVRCSRIYLFYYLPIISVKKRVLNTSLSAQFQSEVSDHMLVSTCQTFKWAVQHLHTKSEERSVSKGASYYFRQAVLLGHFQVASEFKNMIILRYRFSFLQLTASLLYYFRWNVSKVYLWYIRATKKG